MTTEKPLSELAARIKKALEDFFQSLPDGVANVTTGLPTISILLGYNWTWPRPKDKPLEPGRTQTEQEILAAIEELVAAGFLVPRSESGGVWDIPGKKEDNTHE